MGTTRIRRFALVTLLALTVGGIAAVTARADAPDVKVSTVVATSPHGPQHPVTTATAMVDTVTHAVRVDLTGGWSWPTHGDDCNTDRAGAGVAVNWNDPKDPGFHVATFSIPNSNYGSDFGVGSSVATSYGTNESNVIDDAVHPTENDTGTGAVVDIAGSSSQIAASSGTNSYLNWRGGCGVYSSDLVLVKTGMPPVYSYTTENTAHGNFGMATPTSTDANGMAFDDPTPPSGSSLQGALLEHWYASTSDLSTICPLTYDVHGDHSPGAHAASNNGVGIPDAAKNVTAGDQAVGSGTYTAIHNNDNSIQSNGGTPAGNTCPEFFFPSITTTLSSLVPVAIGTSVHDSATLHNASADAGGTAKYAWYSSLSACTAGTYASPGGSSLGSKSVALGSVPDSDSTGPINAAGTYYFRVFYSGDGKNYGPVSSACSDEVLVVNPNTPSITTNATPKTGDLSSNLQDSALLSGGSNYDNTGTVTFYLYAPGVTCNTDGSGATYHESGGLVSANGSFSTTVGFGPPLVAGVYHWLAVFSGDGNNNKANSGCTAEPVTITASPSITTNATPKTGDLSSNLQDSALLSGGSNYDNTGTVTFYLYAPGVTCNTDGSGATYHESGGLVSANGSFSTTVGFGPPLVAGVYHWLAVFSGDGNNNKANSGCTAEPVTITASPSITTNATPKTGDLSSNLQDSALLSGGSNYDNTGTVTFYLYAPGVTCNTDGSGATYHESGGLVSANGSFSTTVGFGPPLVAGVYHWLAVFSGDGNNNKANSGCTAEPVTITASPSITTDQTPTSGSVGDTLNDSATLKDTSNLLGTGTVTIYLFEPGVDCNAAGTGAVNSWVFSDVSGNGPFKTSDTAGFVADMAGTYHWLAVFSGDTNNPGPVNSGCESEPVVINPASIQIAKTADATSVNAGDPVGFTVTVYNTGAGDAYGVKLNDPLPTNPGLNWTIDTVTSPPGSGWAGTCTIDQGTLKCGGANGVTVPHDTLQEDSTFTVHITSPTTSDTAGDCRETGLVDNIGHVSTSNDGSGDAEATVCVNPAAIQIAKTADKAQVNVGDPIGFTVTVYNTGAGDAYGVKLNDPLPTNAGLSWTIDHQGTGWGGSCAIAAGVLTCGGANGVTVPTGTTQTASTFTVHITSPTTGATGGDCPKTGVVDNIGNVTTSNDGSGSSEDKVCVQALVDLAITKSGSPATQILGQGNITWTMVVTNNGPSTDTNVKVSDPMPAGNTYVSSTTTQGTCTGGAILNCDLGTMTAGQQVTITLVTTPSASGIQTNTATVSGDRPETNLANNVANASVEITQQIITPPCVLINSIKPGQLIVGRKTTLTIRLTQNHKAAAGFKVRIQGAGINVVTKRSNAKGVIKHSLKMKRKGILRFNPVGGSNGASCGAVRVGVRGPFTPPVTG